MKNNLAAMLIFLNLILLLKMYPKEIIPSVSKDLCIKMFIFNSRKLDTSEMSQTEVIKKLKFMFGSFLFFVF